LTCQTQVTKCNRLEQFETVERLEQKQALFRIASGWNHMEQDQSLRHFTSAMVIPLNPRLRQCESGNDSFSFLRTLREWEGEWGIRNNFARVSANIFFGIANESKRQSVSKNHDFLRCSSLSKMSVFILGKNDELRLHPFPHSLE